MDNWGINTIANWSSKDIIKTNKKPFMLQLDNLTPNKDILGLQNVYAPGFAEYVEESVKKQVEEYKNNPWLIGWFAGNEPAWLGQEERLIDLIRENGDEYFKAAVDTYMKQGDTSEKRKQFAYNTLSTYLHIVNNALKKYDPNHLRIGNRLGHADLPADEILEICKDVFDVYSFNSYTLTPDKKYLDIVSEKTGLPMIVGEFHFGTTDRGMLSLYGKQIIKKNEVLLIDIMLKMLIVIQHLQVQHFFNGQINRQQEESLMAKIIIVVQLMLLICLIDTKLKL